MRSTRWIVSQQSKRTQTSGPPASILYNAAFGTKERLIILETWTEDLPGDHSSKHKCLLGLSQLF